VAKVATGSAERIPCLGICVGTPGRGSRSASGAPEQQAPSDVQWAACGGRVALASDLVSALPPVNMISTRVSVGYGPDRQVGSPVGADPGLGLGALDP
jgi:hypothetical protein